MTRLFITAFLIGAIAISAFAQSWHDGAGAGWYNYAKPQEEKTEEENELQRPVIPARDKVMMMPPKQFQSLYDNVMDYAATYRNIDTFADYEFMRQAAMDRSLEFSSLQQLYNQLNPESTASMEDRRLYDSLAIAKAQDYIAKNKTEYGLMYFYSTTCPYCAKMAPLIESFAETSGWDVEHIDIQQRPALKAAFAVTSTPTILMLDRNKNTYVIATGYVRLDELQNRIFNYIRYIRGETTEITFGQDVTLGQLEAR